MPSHLIFSVSYLAADVLRKALEWLPDGGLRDRIVMERRAGDGYWLTTSTPASPASDDAEQSYQLRITAAAISLVSGSAAGFDFGLRTLFQILAQGNELPVVSIDDRPSITQRALMIDMVRLKEKDHTYFDLLDEMAAWKMNVLFMHFTDNQGCTIELKSHPELVSEYAMPQETLRKLISHAGDLGIRVIPEIEPWGHSRWICNHYPEFLEPDTNSICLAQEGIYPLLEELVSEIASLFPDPYMHIGCDEADYFKHDDCKELANRVGVDAMIANHINRVNRMARQHGKTAMIWADVVVRYDGVLERLDRDIITEEWNYYDQVEPDNVIKLISSGFKTWTAPALIYGGWRVTVSRYNLDNVHRYATIAREQRAEGVSTTVWLPQRYIPGTLGPGIAWAAQQAWGDGQASLDETLAAFMRHRFNLAPTPQRIARFRRIFSAGQRNPIAAFWPDSERLLWHGTQEAHDENGNYAQSVRGLATDLIEDQKGVKVNREDYDSLILAARTAEHIADRRAGGEAIVSHLRQALQDMEHGKSDEAGTHLAAAALTLQSLESQRSALWRTMQRNWDRYRYPDDPFRSGEGDSNSLYWWVGNRESYGFSLDLMAELELASLKPQASFLRDLLGVTLQDYGTPTDEPYVESAT